MTLQRSGSPAYVQEALDQALLLTPRGYRLAMAWLAARLPVEVMSAVEAVSRMAPKEVMDPLEVYRELKDS